MVVGRKSIKPPAGPELQIGVTDCAAKYRSECTMISWRTAVLATCNWLSIYVSMFIDALWFVYWTDIEVLVTCRDFSLLQKR